MAINFYERATSRPSQKTTDSGGVTLTWIAQTTAGENEVAVYRALAGPNGDGTGTAPLVWDGFNRSKVGVTPLGGTVWDCVAEYGPQIIIAGLDQVNSFVNFAGLQVNRGPEFSADTTGKTVHVTQGIQTVYRIGTVAGGSSANDFVAQGVNLVIGPGTNEVTPDGYTVSSSDIGKVIVIGPGQGWTPGFYTITSVGATQWFLSAVPGAAGTSGGSWCLYGGGITATSGGTAADYKNAIGVSRDGVEGTDIVVPQLEWTVQGAIAPFDMSNVLTYYQMTGKVNQSTFWGFAAGEVLYYGASVQTTDGIQFRVTHKFVAQPSQYNLQITSQIVIPYKTGWEYVWCAYAPDVSNNFPIQVAIAAYVVQLYQGGDFSQLGLG